MLNRDQAQSILQAALREFAPDWQLVGECSEVTLRNPDHWLSGIGTFGCTLKHRTSGGLKVLGRRRGSEPGAVYHRGVSFLVLEAYADRTIDPIRRYFTEIEVLAPARAVLPLAPFRA